MYIIRTDFPKSAYVILSFQHSFYCYKSYKSCDKCCVLQLSSMWLYKINDLTTGPGVCIRCFKLRTFTMARSANSETCVTHNSCNYVVSSFPTKPSLSYPIVVTKPTTPSAVTQKLKPTSLQLKKLSGATTVLFPALL